MRWIVALLAGCYAPVAPEGAPCGEPPARACPSGQMCGPDNRCHKDPAIDVDAPRGEAGSDGPPVTCTPRRLLTGGQSALVQGWTIQGSGNRSMNESNGLTTLTTSNGGHQLLVLANALPTASWGLQVELQVIQSGGHAPSAAALAIMPSYRAPMGDDNDRKKMLWIETANVGWGDGTSIGANMQQMAQVRIEPTASGGLRATIATGSGAGGSLTTGTATTNGTIAIGDQSTAMGLDSSFQISTIDLYCP